MSKIILFSDLHLHAFKSYSHLTTEGLNSRLLDAVSCVDQVREYADQVDAALVLFGGDFYHVRKNVETATLNLGMDAVGKFERPLVILPGNHDQATSDGSQHLAHPFSKFKWVTVVNEPKWTTNIGVGDLRRIDILCIPYTENSEQVNKLCRTPPKPGAHTKLLLGHLGIVGAKVGADFVYDNINDCSLDDLNAKAFDHVFLGHFHQHQKLAKNVHYIGAPLQHNWGDRGQIRGFVEYDTETKKVKHIPLKAPKFIELSDTEGWDNDPLEGNFIRLLTDRTWTAAEREVTKERIGALSFETAPLTVREDRKQARSTLKPGMPYNEVLRKYVSTQQTDLDPEELASLGEDLMKGVS